MKIAIINGQVLDPSQNIDSRLTVLIEGGRIKDVTKKKPSLDDYEVIDAEGAYVTPGFVDLHTHLREPGYEYRENIESGSRAAAAGGFTTILCMANTDPVNDNPAVTRLIVERAKEVGLIKILPVGAISKELKGEALADIGEMVEAGCVAISDDGRPVMSSKLMRHALEYSKSFNIPIITHAEDLDLSHGGCMHEGKTSVSMGLKGIPAAAEESMIQRDILLADLTRNRLHIAHVSTARGMEMVRQAKKEKLPVTCEVTPHHLTLTDEECLDYNTIGKVNPPLRPRADCEALIRAINDGTVDAIATDHAPHSNDEKTVTMDQANCGIIGMETALPVLLSLVHKKKIAMKRLIQLLTIGPARAFGLKAGTLKKGSAADVVIFDANKSVTIDPKQFYSKSHNSPFAGWGLKGKILHTICNGRKVYPL